MMSRAGAKGPRLMAELRYEVSFEGVASPTLRAAFAEHELATGPGRTIVRCPPDALSAVIARIEEFGLELLDVRLVAEGTDDEASGTER